MSFYSKIRGTYETLFQIGKTGPQIKRNGAVLEMRDSADAAFAITRGLDPVGNSDFVTLLYFNNNNAAATGLTYVKLPLALVTKVSTLAIPNNAIIMDCRLDITTAYDVGTLWNITRTGDGTKNPLGTGDSDPEVVSVYQAMQTLSWGATGVGTVTATITGTPAAGAAILYIGYVTPNDIS